MLSNFGGGKDALQILSVGKTGLIFKPDKIIINH